MITAVDSESAVTPRDTLALLQEAVTALADVASHPHQLKLTGYSDQLVDAAANSVESLRAHRLRRALGDHLRQHNHQYCLVGMEFDEILIQLFCFHPVVIKLESMQTEGISLHIVLCLLALDSASTRALQAKSELFLAVAGAGNAMIRTNAQISTEWVRQRLKLHYRPAALIAALLIDLTKGIRYLQR